MAFYSRSVIHKSKKMKKGVLLLMLVLSSLQVYSQEVSGAEKGQVQFGIKTGWIQSTLWGKDLGFLAVDGKVKESRSFFAGVSLYTGIGTYFGLKHELFYQQHGADFERVFEKGAIHATLAMHSLRFNPISPTFKLGGLEVYAGPYVNTLLYASVTAVDDNGNRYKDHLIFGSEEEDTEDYKYLQKMDYGFVGGVEYKFRFGLSIGAYYSKGFAALFDNANTHGLEENAGAKDLKIYNESFGFSLGYYF